uniref:uncharacterized protein LOC122605188 n=1 Tax=Erigeron canadensis TaxID=72917 RepID=UPI001CB8F569|nr:uncharacterized protein LOC122605188 [Erigeron canadensis]XP_043634021.1 uncharacterized protein LOC122605188 [Erigeron canadensis]XP_043634022.1 uncharacterized protein LOC122605188 [Erigeron canadensis]XP_043634023.1 uncharacterized protein LOC122605188 [Erigeron canadensis]
MMNTSDEWKSLWPISLVHSAPLLIDPTTTKTAKTIKEIGPVIFDSSSEPQTHVHLFSSPSLHPQLPPPFPTISLPRFLATSSGILPSTAASIAALELPSSSSSSLPDCERLIAHNCLHLFRCPGTNLSLAFFPTGSNSDQVGFVVLSVENSQLKMRGAYAETEVFTSPNALSHRIVNISMNPLADCEYDSGNSAIGYLLAYTSCSVNYYRIKITTDGSGKITPLLELAGNKLFKSSAIVHACWSPHLPEESSVLLENGDLFILDLDSHHRPSITSLQLSGKKLKVLWGESIVSEISGGWLSCDFSWHPRILIVVHSSAVFLVDSRSKETTVTPLLKIDVKNGSSDRFVAFSIAGPDRFYYTLVSSDTVYLCDIRKPMIPLIRWTHNLANPSYVIVSSMSDLRSQSKDATYNWASEAGYGILLGSFWNCQFSLLCYGPDVRNIKSISPSYHAWGLPSDLSLTTNECRCGSCLVKEEFSKDQLHNWVNWQEKKIIVLGFGILDKELSSQLFKSDMFGGFTLITLTSAGNMELHRYCASWGYSQTSEKGHVEHPLGMNDSVLYERDKEKYKFRKVYLYHKLEWLDGYLEADLARILSMELVKIHENKTLEKACLGEDFHKIICQKLNTYSSGGVQGSINTHDVLKDVDLPTSIHEIALRSVLANLPKQVLRFGFSNYSSLPDISRKKDNHLPFEFLEVPCHQSHLPPFSFRDPSSRGTKWSGKQKPSSSLVGPVTPIPFLMTFHKTRMLKADNQSADSEIDHKCYEVVRVANGITETESHSCDDFKVSLADDNEDMFHSSAQQFAAYKPTSMVDSVFSDGKHANMMFKVGKKNEKDMFDLDCPLKFMFDDQASGFESDEAKAYELLNKQFSSFSKGLHSYQDYITKSNIPK